MTAAWALPQGGTVSAGQASISQTANQTTINQGSQRAIVDWNSFNVAQGESVQFNQPSSSAVTLNRVHDASPSQIHGALNANGRVFIVNNNGILFSKDAQVNVGGLLATILLEAFGAVASIMQLGR